MQRKNAEGPAHVPALQRPTIPLGCSNEDHRHRRNHRDRTIARTETDCDSYDQGFHAMQRTLQEGTRLISIRVER
ncbi:hypothetical protein [Arthrobacter dokdonensis]|uniref:hypothetical protein n=1 Tax=Arthrobacter dokdonellae TaxID=2211210 RepID=UPI000DE5A430|nr:hypothetical protein [Arthrobacter dokdonellae]